MNIAHPFSQREAHLRAGLLSHKNSVRSSLMKCLWVLAGLAGFLVSPIANALEELGPVEGELDPYVPGILESGVLVSYQRPDGYTWSIETLKPTQLGRRIRGADSCVYTYGPVPLPYFINKTCPIDPTKNKTRDVRFKREAIESLDAQSRFKFLHTPDKRRFTFGCKMRDPVRIRVIAGDFDTYKLRCQSGRGYNDWYLSPELGIVVAQSFTGDPRRELAGLQATPVIGELDYKLPPYLPFNIPTEGGSLVVLKNGVQELLTDFQVDDGSYSYLGKTCRTQQDALFEWAWFTERECESGYSVTGQYETRRDRTRPITAKTRFTAKYSNVNNDGREVNLNIKCRVERSVRIDIGVREIDTYEMNCETPYQIHTSWLSPELGRAVADQWYHKRKKKRSIRLFLDEL